MQSTKPILNISNLKISFYSDSRWNEVLHGVDFSLAQGEILGIVGESGSGKSVSMLAVMQLLNKGISKVNSGEIIFTPKDGSNIDLLKSTEKEMQRIRGNEITMIFQEPMTALNPVQRCGEQMLEAILHHQKLKKKEAKQKVLDLFAEVLLPDPQKAFDSYPHQLSGGQRQRVMIAMAISSQPSILIADEPTTALDVTVQKSILETLKSLQRKTGMSVVFITHDLGVIAEIADRVLVMYRGNIVETGSVEEVLQNPTHPYTQGLMACKPSLDKRLEKLPTVADFLDKNHAFEEHIISANQRQVRREKLYAQLPVLEIKHLSTSFVTQRNLWGKAIKKFDAVKDISFSVYEGETLGLVGESGCGKSTLGKNILRLIEAQSGRIIYKGKDLMQYTSEEMRQIRRKLQIIFQDPYSSLNPRFTAGETILEPMRVHHLWDNDVQRKQKVLEILENVGLQPAHFNRYPHEFSGGQRQRICIARALALQPELIICDESVSALDVSVQAQVINLLNDLKNDYHFTYIFISHDLSVVKFMSDRMLVMQSGKIVEEGDPDVIYKSPQTAYTQKLIASIPGVR